MKIGKAAGPTGVVSEMMKAAGPTGVVSEMMKAAGGFGSRWMTDLINNIVKEGCISDDWRKSILVPVYLCTMGKVIHLLSYWSSR